MKTWIRDLEGIKYRKLFEYMKQYGVEPFRDFFADYNELRDEDLLLMAILDRRHGTLSLTKKHSDVLRIIRELEHGRETFFQKDFAYLFDTVDEDNLPKCIEGAYALEELGIAKVSSIPVSWKGATTYIDYNEKDQIYAIEKFYTNGDIRYKPWETGAFSTLISFKEQSNGNFIIQVQNEIGKPEYRYAYISDFCFDPSLLPSSDELSSLEPPKSLTESKVYVKKV